MSPPKDPYGDLPVVEAHARQAADQVNALAGASSVRQGEIAMRSTGVEVQSLEELFRFANAVAASDLSPAGFKKAEQIIVAIQMGAELGLSKMRSLHAFSVVKGTPKLRGHAALALIRASGMLKPGTSVKHGCRKNADGKLEGYCWTWRADEEGPQETVFSEDDARRAGLWDDDPKSMSAWRRYPKRMLNWRAVGFHADDHFSDVTFGIALAETTDPAAESPKERDVTPSETPEDAISEPSGDTPLADRLRGSSASRGAAAAAKKARSAEDMLGPQEEAEDVDFAEAPRDPDPEDPPEDETPRRKAPAKKAAAKKAAAKKAAGKKAPAKKAAGKTRGIDMPELSRLADDQLEELLAQVQATPHRRAGRQAAIEAILEEQAARQEAEDEADDGQGELLEPEGDEGDEAGDFDVLQLFRCPDCGYEDKELPDTEFYCTAACGSERLMEPIEDED